MALTNTKGKTINVYLQKTNKTEVTVKLVSTHKTHVLKLADLDVASQGTITKWKAAGGGCSGGGCSTDFEIDFHSGRSSRSQDGYFDERTLSLKGVVTIANGDNNLETKPAKVTVLTLGRPMKDPTLMRVLQKESHELPSIGGGGEHLVVLKNYRATYSDGSYKSGAKYLGYIVVVHEGRNVIVAKSVPATLSEKYGNQIFKLKEGKTYDKYLDEIDMDE